MKKEYITPKLHIEHIECDNLLQAISTLGMNGGSNDHLYDGPPLNTGDDDETAAAKNGNFFKLDFDIEFDDM